MADEDYYEDDEPLDKIQAIRRRKPDFVTGGRAAAGATQYLSPSVATGRWVRTEATVTCGWTAGTVACL